MGIINVNSISNEAGTGAPNFPNGLSVNSNPLPTAGSLSNRNRIINGAMVIDQRNAGASVTPAILTNAVTLDRWNFYLTQASKLTTQQNAGAVSPPVGFSNYLGVTSTSAYSVLSDDTFVFRQKIEGYNVADLALGTADAKTFTVSFWVRSSLTGSFGGAFVNGAVNRSYTFSYTISSADTWEYKTITVAGDTSGTWLTNNSAGLEVRWGLGSGATFSTTAGSWQSGNFVQPTGTVSVVGTNGATFYITGVQLEVGDTATPFEHRPYGQELALCQRYFQKIGEVLGRYVMSGVILNQPTRAAFPTLVTEMRATPTIVTRNNGTGAVGELREFSSNVARTVTAIYSVTLVGGGYAQMNTTLYQSLEIVAEYSAEL